MQAASKDACGSGVCVCPNGPLGGFTQSQEGGQSWWRERRKCIFDLIRARVCRAKAQRSREVIQGALTSELPHLGSSVQTHPCLPLCRNLTNVFLSLACVVLLGKTEDLVLVPCSSNVLCWQETEQTWLWTRQDFTREADCDNGSCAFTAGSENTSKSVPSSVEPYCIKEWEN